MYQSSVENERSLHACTSLPSCTLDSKQAMPARRQLQLKPIP